MEIYSVRSKKYGMLHQMTHVLVDSNEVVIVDAGADIDDLIDIIDGKKVLAVLITHCHFDHISSIEEYIEKWNVNVYISKGAEKKFSDPISNCSFLIGEKTLFNVPQKNIKYYAEKLKIGNFEIDVIDTPGHSADSVCLLIDSNLFCGDLVLGGTIGRCDLIDSNVADMRNSLAKLKYIDFKIAYPGHYDKLTKQEVLNSF